MDWEQDRKRKAADDNNEHSAKLPLIVDDYAMQSSQDSVASYDGELDGQDMEQNLEYKIFNDPIHGHIEVHPLCVKIMDTPQFQRLRFLKQLGACYFVFPGAAHNRFEHCLGVYHLAGQLIRALHERQPELEITKEDILCVQIAGLCHDLGHGPFSHLFDGKFLSKVRPDLIENDKKWKHEDGSKMMFDHLIKENNLMKVFNKYGLTETDCIFIKEQISGPSVEESKDKSSKKRRYVGRKESKLFLYEIVANKRNDIDVDKWDYFARDCHNLGLTNNFDHQRLMKFARVIKVNDEFQICCRDKEVNNLYDMFYTRYTLHRRAYQHTATNIIETMITEALVKANDHLLFRGSGRSKLKMSHCIDDPVAFEKLTDAVFQEIQYSDKSELAESRQILNNILKRQLYKCVGQSIPNEKFGSLSGKKVDTCKIKREIKRDVFDFIQRAKKDVLTIDDLEVQIVNLDYGMDDENPIDHVRFYNKRNPDEAIQLRKDEVSKMLPKIFEEQYVRIICKKRDKESVELATQGFHDWCSEHGNKITNAFLPDMTPVKSFTDQGPNTPTPFKPTSSVRNYGSIEKAKSRLQDKFN